MSTIQKWLAGLTGLGALYLVTAKPDSIVKLGSAAKNVTAGSITSITTGGTK